MSCQRILLGFTTSQAVFESLDGIRKKFDEPEMKEKFKGFKRDIQFKFSDLNVTYTLRVTEDATASLSEGGVEKPDIAIDTDSATFLGIRNKSVSATRAYMTGKIKVKGSMPDLLRMQKLL